MTVNAPGGSSADVRSIARQATADLEALQKPKTPSKICEYANAAALPDPARWRSSIVFVKSIDRVAVSNGTNWLRVDTGASL